MAKWVEFRCYVHGPTQTRSNEMEIDPLFGLCRFECPADQLDRHIIGKRVSPDLLRQLGENGAKVRRLGEPLPNGLAPITVDEVTCIEAMDLVTFNSIMRQVLSF